MLMQDLAVETKWSMFHNRAISLLFDSFNAVYSFFKLLQATFSCPPAAISSHNFQDKSTSRLIKETEATGCIYSQKIQASQKSEKETEGTEQL